MVDDTNFRLNPNNKYTTKKRIGKKIVCYDEHQYEFSPRFFFPEGTCIVWNWEMKVQQYCQRDHIFDIVAVDTVSWVVLDELQLFEI